MKTDAIKKLQVYFFRYNSVLYKKGEIILRPSDELNSVYYIQTGFVKSYYLFRDGRELTYNIFKSGSYFPMLSIIGNVNNSYYYQTMTPTKIIKAPRQETLTYVKKDPEVLFELTSRIVVGLNGLLDNMKYLLFGSARTRVVSVLLISVNRFGEKMSNKQILIKLPLTHQDIANLAGITRETTSLEIEKLIKKGFLLYKKRHIVVMNYSKLKSEIEIETNT